MTKHDVFHFRNWKFWHCGAVFQKVLDFLKNPWSSLGRTANH
ncbi:Uncharacterised protein [Vibrio cholerae]|nr:Uncharacterised protein [Vibrio cholerae]